MSACFLNRPRPWPLVVAGCAVCTVAFADGPFADWQVTGTNTLRAESYSVRGDPASGPYAFTGGQYFDELNLGFVRRFSPYDTLRGQLYGVANDSRYRSTDQGFVPERVSVSREKGDAPIPYRVEAGDTYAYFSYRTLQRSLKGVQVELQPATGDTSWRQSVVFVSGANQPSWRHAQLKDDWTTGLSWLVDAGASHWSVNVVHNLRQADPAAGTPERTQTVASLAADHGWQWDTQRLRAEGEIAGLHGDTDGFTDATGMPVPGSRSDRRGTGAFAQLSGQCIADPLDYRLRYERYDRDFRPAAGIVPADHEAEEAHLGWRFAGGLALRARAQRYVDGLQSGNALKTSTYGLALAGPFVAGTSGVTGSVDTFWQGLRKDDSSIDRGTWNLNANLSKPLGGRWMGNLGLFVQQVDDRVAGAPDTSSVQLQLGASHAVSFGGWSGSITPGVTLRRTHGDPFALEDVSPSLAIALAGHSSTFSASYGYQRLQPENDGFATVTVNALRLDYRYTTGRSTFGIEASAYDRRVTIGQYNDTYRISASWTYVLDKPARSARPYAPALAAAMTGALPQGVGILAAIVPGADYDAVLARLDAAGVRGASSQDNAAVFEQRLVGDLAERQRLVVEDDLGRVTRVALLVNPDDPGDAQSVSRAYERVRKALLDRFGSPAFTLEEGTIGPTLVADLNAGRVVRVMEWRTPTGTLRLGIPRRLDGQVRIEVQHAAGFGPPRDLLWSMDAVR